MSYPGPHVALRCASMELRRIPSGALAGAAGRRCLGGPAAARQAGFRVATTTTWSCSASSSRATPAGRPPGLAIHMANGAAFGAVYALRAPAAPGPARSWPAWPPALAEHVALWPLGALVDRHHPARRSSSRCRATAARSRRPPGATRCSASCSASSSAGSTPRGSSSRSSRCRSRRTATATSSTRPPERPRHRLRARRRNRTDNLFITSEVLCQLS